MTSGLRFTKYFQILFFLASVNAFRIFLAVSMIDAFSMGVQPSSTFERSSAAIMVVSGISGLSSLSVEICNASDMRISTLTPKSDFPISILLRYGTEISALSASSV